MKVLIVFAACIIVAQAWTEEQKDRIRKHRGECLADTGADDASVKILKSGELKEASESMDKYAYCMLIKLELMTKDGKFNKDVALANVPLEDKVNFEKVIDSCLANKGHSPAISAWSYVMCFHDRDPKHSILL